MQVDELGTVLGVWAHPDDEAYLSAGLMARTREGGRRVVVVTATYGELGATDTYHWGPERLSVIRRHELAASLAVVGVGEHHWLGLRDGECADTDATPSVVELIEETEPDTILTFGPEGMTGHPDHIAVSTWTTRAWVTTGCRGRLLYATQTPQFHETWGEINDRLGIWMSGTRPSTAESDLAVHVRLAGEQLDRKAVALRAHASQVSGVIQEMGLEQFIQWFAEESFVAADPVVARSEERTRVS